MKILTQVGDYLFRNRRKKKIIDFNTQLLIAFEMVFHVFAFCALIGIILYVEPLATLFSSYSANTHQNIVMELFEINIGKWPLFVGALVILSVLSVLFSHRICGPAFKIEKMLNAYGDRDLRHSTFLRHHDYLTSLVPPANKVRDTMTHDVAELKKLALELEELSQKVESEEEQQKMKTSLEQFRSILSRYSVSDA